MLVTEWTIEFCAVAVSPSEKSVGFGSVFAEKTAGFGSVLPVHF